MYKDTHIDFTLEKYYIILKYFFPIPYFEVKYVNLRSL